MTQGTSAPRWDYEARRWWESLQDYDADGNRNRNRDRAGLARLRRASTPVEALEEPAVLQLYTRLGFGKGDRTIERRLPRVAVIAAVLAHIRSDANRSEGGFRLRFAEMLGRGDRPIMSPLRFKRLMSATSDQDILVQFRRAVALADGKNIDVGDVAKSLLDWDDQRRMRWAFDYYGAGSAAPKASDTAISAPADEE